MGTGNNLSKSHIQTWKILILKCNIVKKDTDKETKLAKKLKLH